MQKALAQAEALRQAGRHEEGINLLLDVLRYGEAKAQVLFRLGNLYFDRGDLARAEHAYRRATEEDPRHSSAHHNLGVVYRRQGKISQSVRMLKRARWLDVRYPRAVNLSPVQRRILRRRVWPMALLPVAGLGLIILVLWLVGRII